MTAKDLGFPQDIKIRIGVWSWSSHRKLLEQNCLSCFIQRTTRLPPGKKALVPAELAEKKVHFFIEILLWTCFAFFFLSTSGLIWKTGARKWLISPPVTHPPRSRPMLRVCYILPGERNRVSLCFTLGVLIFVGTWFANRRPNHAVHFSYTQSGICTNTKDIQHLIKGSFSFARCCMVWKAKRNKPQKTEESWHVEHCMPGIKHH